MPAKTAAACLNAVLSANTAQSSTRTPRCHGLRVSLPRVSLLLLLLTACSEPQQSVSSGDHNTRAIPVRVASVEMRQDDETLRFASVSRVRQRADLTFQVSGVIQQRAVEIGQSVTAGQTLMTVYSPALQPSYDAARHRLAQLQADQLQASSELERLQTLYQRGVIPLQEIEQQDTRVNALKSAVANAEAVAEQASRLLQEAELTAPFDATVEQLLLEPGEFVQAGQTVIRISSTSELEAEIRLPAHLAATLSIGQMLPVWNSLAGSDSQHPAQTASIVEIGQSSTGSNALYPVIVALNDDSIRTGEAIEVGVPRTTQPALVIPISAVMRSADGLTVFMNSNGRAQRVAVEIDQLQGEFAVIKPGSLALGAQIVYTGLTRLADGDLIEALP